MEIDLFVEIVALGRMILLEVFSVDELHIIL